MSLQLLATLFEFIKDNSQKIAIDISCNFNRLGQKEVIISSPRWYWTSIMPHNLYELLPSFTCKAIIRLLESKELKQLVLEEIREELRTMYHDEKHLEIRVLSILNAQPQKPMCV